MRLPDDFDHKKSKVTPIVVSTLVAVTLFLGILIGIVVFVNRKENNTQASDMTEIVLRDSLLSETGYADTDDILTGSRLTPEDLDFWDQYPKEQQIIEGEEEKQEAMVVAEEDPATDGKHTLIKKTDGSEEWVLISPFLPKHNYQFMNLVCQSGMMKYYVDGKQVSFIGTDLSKYQDYVDFGKVKKAGVDFVMLRVGARGYGTGQLLLDEYFKENVKRALDAGLQVGAYFFSQAISEEEALEEAQLVVDTIQEYDITYPVAFDMEKIVNDTSRIDSLTRAEKTNIAKIFLDVIEEAGYIPMLYGNKEWLIKQVDLSKLTEYDVWISQSQDIPDFPYQFTMWQYSQNADVDGIAGYADLNISFIDYSEK